MQPKRTTPKVLGLLLVSAFAASSCSKDPDPILRAESVTSIVSHNPSPSVVGQPVTVSFNVVGLDDDTEPTGDVIVSDGHSHTCQASVQARSCAIALPTAGSVNISASYQGDSHYLPSVAAVTHQVGTAAGSVTTITSDNPDPSQAGQDVTVAWTVVPRPPATGTPTGTVTVSDGAGASCAAPVAAGSCSLTLTTSGNKTLTATYSGDSAFSGSSDTEPHVVSAVGSAASVTTIVSDSPDPSKTGQAVTVSWTVVAQPPATGTPTGTVTIDGGGGITCSASVATGSCSLTFPTAGAKTLTASYAGDTVFAASADTEPHTVDKGATTLVITDAPDPTMIGQPVQVSWVVAPTAPATGTPTGNVTVTVGAASCAATVAAGSCSVTPLTSGALTFNATYAGDANFLSSTDSENHQVRTPVFEPGDPTPAALTISMQPVAVSGNLVTVRIAVTDVNDFFGAAFRVNYDPAVVAFDSSDTTGSFLLDGGVPTQLSVNGATVSGSVLVGVTRVDAETNAGVDVAGTRELLTLTFRVIGVPAAAGSPLTFGDPKEVRDSVQPPPEGNLIVVTWIGGTVKGQ